MFIFENFILYLIWAILIVICYTDIRYRIIANSIIIALFFIILTNFFLGFGKLNYISALIFFIIGLIMYTFKLIGAGDIKLITVLLLSLSYEEVWNFLIMMTLLGLPLAVIAIIWKMITKSKVTIPYGVAIGLSYFITTYLSLTST